MIELHSLLLNPNIWKEWGSSSKEGVCMFRNKNIHKDFKARWLLDGGRLREKCTDPAQLWKKKTDGLGLTMFLWSTYIDYIVLD